MFSKYIYNLITIKLTNSELVILCQHHPWRSAVPKIFLFILMERDMNFPLPTPVVSYHSNGMKISISFIQAQNPCHGFRMYTSVISLKIREVLCSAIRSD